MANRRLTIVDLSPAGHQPMCSEDGSVWVAHNGEIYNFPDLKRELAGKGHAFRSNTDTEVIIHAYEEWGPGCLHRFNGMWGFCILDLDANRMFLARDRFGIKPLYYHHGEGTFLFSSEIKGLLASGLVASVPDEGTLAAYLDAGVVNYRHLTFFRDVCELPPGHCIELDLERGSPAVSRYYRIPAGVEKTADEIAIAEELLHLFNDAVRIRLISDVPVGSCLSGGLDSSSIVCALDRLMRDEGLKIPGSSVQKTFSARYRDARHDEGEFIGYVNELTGSESHFTYPGVEGLREDLDGLLWHQEEPFGSTSMYAQWCVFRLAKETGVTVTLDGQGGDELLGGYMKYRFPFLGQLIRSGRLGSWLREIRAMSSGKERAAKLVRKSLRWALPAGLRRLWPGRSSPGKAFLEAGRAGDNPFLQALLHDFENSLTTLLRFEDRNGMAHSIESRLPFMDYRIVELCFSLPDDMKIRDGTTKWILRRAMDGILPPAVRDRMDKVGFSTPEDAWFRNEFREMTEELFRSEPFLSRSCYDHAGIGRDLDLHLSGKRNRSGPLWRHVNAELWFRAFVD
jgi:asparagine synthase (glutamine-hydrolysing)